MRRDYRLTKYGDGQPTNISDFISIGGMAGVEYVAAAKAAEDAKRFERELWMEKLERWLANGTDGHYALNDFETNWLEVEIKRLKRVLGMCKTPEKIRSSTKERVRRYRERLEKERAEWKKTSPVSQGGSRVTATPGAVAAAYKFLLQNGQEPTEEGVKEIFKGAISDVDIVLALSDLKSAGHLDRIRSEVLS
jgi:hypothetical protein